MQVDVTHIVYDPVLVMGTGDHHWATQWLGHAGGADNLWQRR